MRWIKQNWTLFSILVLAVSAMWMAFTTPPPGAVTGGQIPAPKEGFLAPDFTLEDAQGQIYRLSELQGKPVLVNLWASWCAPCKEEMPAMQAVYETYAPQGFMLLAVNATSQDSQSAAIDFAQARGLTFPILFDRDGAVTTRYQVQAMPTSFFVDQQGIVRKVIIGGPMTQAFLVSEIEHLLAEK